MQIEFEHPCAQQFGVFQVTQLSPDTFLEDFLGLDVICIAERSASEVHRHNASDAVIFIISGSGYVTLNGKNSAVSPGLRVTIPRGVWHGFYTEEEKLLFVSAQIPPILDKKAGIFDREISTE